MINFYAFDSNVCQMDKKEHLEVGSMLYEMIKLDNVL
jgi:hypothetical protein